MEDGICGTCLRGFLFIFYCISLFLVYHFLQILLCVSVAFIYHYNEIYHFITKKIDLIHTSTYTHPIRSYIHPIYLYISLDR